MTNLYEGDYPAGIEATSFPIDAPLTFGEKCISTLFAFLIVGAVFWAVQFLADTFGWTL